MRPDDGYLLIDHRDSPGISAEDMYKAGLGVHALPPGSLMEFKTKTCCHCGDIVVLNSERIRERGHCRKCDRYVCDKAECRAHCTPRAKLLDHTQEQYFRRDAGYTPLPNLPWQGLGNNT